MKERKEEGKKVVVEEVSGGKKYVEGTEDNGNISKKTW